MRNSVFFIMLPTFFFIFSISLEDNSFQNSFPVFPLNHCLIASCNLSSCHIYYIHHHLLQELFFYTLYEDIIISMKEFTIFIFYVKKKKKFHLGIDLKYKIERKIMTPIRELIHKNLLFKYSFLEFTSDF